MEQVGSFAGMLLWGLNPEPRGGEDKQLSRCFFSGQTTLTNHCPGLGLRILLNTLLPAAITSGSLLAPRASPLAIPDHKAQAS